MHIMQVVIEMKLFADTIYVEGYFLFIYLIGYAEVWRHQLKPIECMLKFSAIYLVAPMLKLDNNMRYVSALDE